jgi:hypothetical protein
MRALGGQPDEHDDNVGNDDMTGSMRYLSKRGEGLILQLINGYGEKLPTITVCLFKSLC